MKKVIHLNKIAPAKSRSDVGCRRLSDVLVDEAHQELVERLGHY